MEDDEGMRQQKIERLSWVLETQDIMLYNMRVGTFTNRESDTVRHSRDPVNV